MKQLKFKTISFLLWRFFFYKYMVNVGSILLVNYFVMFILTV